MYIAHVESITAIDVLAIALIWTLGLFAQRLGIIVYAIFALPGTVMHEAAHFIVGLLFRARPTFPSLIPEKIEGGWKLGSVNFIPTFINVIPVSLAPMTLLPGAIVYAAYVMHPAHGAYYVLHAWVTGTVLKASTPSSQDWKVAAPALIVVVAVGVGIYILN